MTHPHHPAKPRRLRAICWPLMSAAGVLLWMLGLFALGVSADLPMWRQIAGAVLMILAVLLWQAA